MAPHPVLCSVAFALSSLLPCAAAGQQGAVTFKHFHQYPTGQWQQTGQAYRNGAPVGEPISSTNCTGPVSPATAAAIKNLGKSAATQCTTRVVTDTERLAESEQTCDMGGRSQVNHMTMRAVDDKTIAMDVRATLGGQEIVDTRSTVRYQGTCVPTPISAMPQMPKPTAEDCKQIAEMKQQASESAKSCTAAPAAERASCEALMQRMTKQVEQASLMCR